VSGHHSFNCDGFLIALHGSLSTPRFYERVGNIVNELGLERNRARITRILL
jgi:hypothetical protein